MTGLDEYVANNGNDVEIKLVSDGMWLTGKVIDETPLYYVLKSGDYTRLVFKANILLINLQ